MNNLVVLQTFTYRHEAEVAKAMLESNSIKSVIQADDCGGVDPAINFASAVRLMVYEKDLQKAKSIIKE